MLKILVALGILISSVSYAQPHYETVYRQQIKRANKPKKEKTPSVTASEAANKMAKNDRSAVSK